MKTVIQARRVEAKRIDFKRIEYLWDNVDPVDLLTPDLEYYLKNRKADMVDLYSIFKNPQNFGIYKCRRGKIWLIHRYDYLYTGLLEDTIATYYGYMRVHSVLKEFKCKETMFIESVYDNGRCIGGARKQILIPQGDRIIIGTAISAYITSLKDIRVTNILSKLYSTGGLL